MPTLGTFPTLPKPANTDGGLSLAGAGVDVTVLAVKAKEISDRAGVCDSAAVTGGNAGAAAFGCSSEPTRVSSG